MQTSFAVTMFVFGVVAIEVWETQIPVWAFVLSLIICASARLTCILPIDVLTFSVPVCCPCWGGSGYHEPTSGLNVITELTIGYALPGRPIVMMFKTWGYIIMSQALQFTSDFKLGHYMKIPHRVMFVCKVVATVVAGTVQLGVQTWVFSNIPDICSTDPPDDLICPSTTVFGTASIIVNSGFFFSIVWLVC
jgi:hypothetical protein